MTFILVHEEAHARFDASKRTYEYHINTYKDPFLQDRKLVLSPRIRLLTLMNKASKITIQSH